MASIGSFHVQRPDQRVIQRHFDAAEQIKFVTDAAAQFVAVSAHAQGQGFRGHPGFPRTGDHGAAIAAEVAAAVVAVGGAGSVPGSALGALLLGVFDVAGKYYLPEAGAFIIYALMIAVLMVSPAGLRGRRL